MDCIFCKIANKEIPAKIAAESKEVIAFYDVKPIAPVHILVIPKVHISSISKINDKDKAIMGELILTAKKIADNVGISEKGYKLLIRVGKDGGQEIDHIHLHILGGARLSENIHPIDK